MLSGALNSCHLAQGKGNEELCDQQIYCVDGLSSSALKVSFEMSTHVNYSVYFHPMLRLKLSQTSSRRFGRLFFYIFRCSMIISAWTHSWRDAMLLKEFVNIWLLVSCNKFILYLSVKWMKKNLQKCFWNFLELSIHISNPEHAFEEWHYWFQLRIQERKYHRKI